MAAVYSSITFKEFSAWCNERAADGKWSMNLGDYMSQPYTSF